MRASSTSIALVSLLSSIMAFGGCSSSNSTPADQTGGDDAGGTVDPTPTDSGTASDDVATVPETPAAPQYPAGPYGLTVGKVFPLVTFQGYKDGGQTWGDISTASYYDPTGSRGITGIYFVVAAQWCGPCNVEARMLGPIYGKSYKSRGAVFATTMIETTKTDSKGYPLPATQATVTTWRDGKHINFDVMLDEHGADSLPQSGSVGLPHNYIIDPRTMKITKVLQGIDPYIVACGAAGQAPCCSPSSNDGSPGCCDPNDSACDSANACPCPIVTAGSTAADVTWTCEPTTGYCAEGGAQGIINNLETVMVKNGAKPLITVK